MPVSISGTNGVTFPDSSLQAAAASPYVLKNRIINGDMRIDQRNAGASVTVNSASNFFSCDRFLGSGTSSAGVYTIQQVSDAPTGFTNSLKITTTTASASLGSSADYLVGQKIEGFNFADMQWGTANAQTVTLSFRVKSSLTGTFAGVLANSAWDRSYVFTYVISAANTWETKTITIAGDTTGTWLTTNGTGLRLFFSIGSGSSYVTSGNSWVAGTYETVSGATNIISTLNATWQITGVQLEIGTSATPFERRLYNQELANCQRYYQTLPFDAGYVSVGATLNTNSVRGPLFQLNVNMRATPTITLPTAGSGAGQLHYTTSSGAVPSTIGTNSALGVQVNSFRVEGDSYTSAFTAGQTSLLRVGTGGGASITASAEL